MLVTHEEVVVCDVHQLEDPVPHRGGDPTGLFTLTPTPLRPDAVLPIMAVAGAVGDLLGVLLITLLAM